MMVCMISEHGPAINLEQVVTASFGYTERGLTEVWLTFVTGKMEKYYEGDAVQIAGALKELTQFGRALAIRATT